MGVPKVACCAEHFRAISPQLVVDARDAMFTAEAAEELLLLGATGQLERPQAGGGLTLGGISQQIVIRYIYIYILMNY